MPEQVTTTANSVVGGIIGAFNKLLAFIPTLLGALVLLAVGWFISKGLGKLVAKLLHATKVDHAVDRTGLRSYVPGGAEKRETLVSDSVGFVVKWGIFLIFIQAAANLLGMPQITQITNSILLFIPNLIVALLILVVGAVAAKWLSGLVERSLDRFSGVRPQVFGMITRYAIIGFTVIAVLNQLDVATVLVNTLFIGLVASLALALGLAFGLGGQGVANQLTRNWYEGSQKAKGRLRAVQESEATRPTATGKRT